MKEEFLSFAEDLKRKHSYFKKKKTNKKKSPQMAEAFFFC